MDSEIGEVFHKNWPWLISAYQGQAIALKANVTLKDGACPSHADLPDEFEYCHFTNVLFSPPDQFAAYPWPIEAFNLVNDRGWVKKSELPFLRIPTESFAQELEKIWTPKGEEAPPISTSTDVDQAKNEAKRRTALIQKLKGQGMRVGR